MATQQAPIEDGDATGKRRRILNAALAVFADHGVHGTAVPPIAREAGVAVGTLYRYFDSKEELVNAVFRDTKSLLCERLLTGLNPTTGDFHSHFVRIWERLVAFAQTEPAAFRFLEMQDHSQYLDHDSRNQEKALLGPLREMIRTGQANGAFNPALRPEVAIALFWGAVVGLFKANKHGYLELDPTDLDAAREACWHALTAPRPESSR